LLERAARVFREGKAECVVYDTTDENDLVWGVGLGCHGVVHVLLERVCGLPDALHTVDAAWARREASVIVTRYQAGADQRLGTLPLAPSPLVEEAVARAHREQRSQHVVEAGASYFVEYAPPPVSLTLFGAGEDARPLAALAAELGWQVRVVDPRAAFATADRFPQADTVQVAAPENAATLPFDAWSVAVIMTHHYRFDLPLLRALLPRTLPYLGLLGPRLRAERLLSDLRKEGMAPTADMLARLHAPVGLDLGAGTPEAVALCIIAEIQSVLSGRDARPLRERTQPINA
jgi:xanthine/CO dehydrogenase XdhC/CoxF family maturation factor